MPAAARATGEGRGGEGGGVDRISRSESGSCLIVTGVPSDDELGSTVCNSTRRSSSSPCVLAWEDARWALDGGRESDRLVDLPPSVSGRPAAWSRSSSAWPASRRESMWPKRRFSIASSSSCRDWPCGGGDCLRLLPLASRARVSRDPECRRRRDLDDVSEDEGDLRRLGRTEIGDACLSEAPESEYEPSSSEDWWPDDGGSICTRRAVSSRDARVCSLESLLL